MELRRVVVTGMGIVSPLGCGIEPAWSNLLASKSGARRIDDFEIGDLACQIACRIPLGAFAEGKFNPDEWMDVKEQRKVDPFIIFGMAAASQAIADAGIESATEEERERIGVLIGSGIGGIGGIFDASVTLYEKGPRRISPFFIPGRIINMVSGNVSIRFGFKGPNHSVVTACSTGAHAIGDSWRIIAMGDADVMVAGGAESPVNRLSMAGFAACRALSTGSSFHEHFKTLTAMTPLQYQKQLRLLEAQRLMVAGDVDAARAGYRVGYESASQFSREYARMFGAPPARHAAGLRTLPA